MRSNIGIGIATMLIARTLGKSLEKRGNPQYVCSGIYGPVSSLDYEIATGEILKDGLNRFDIPVQWDLQASHPFAEQECGKQWNEAGCLVVMNCYGAVQVSYSDIYRVSRAMSQCTYGGQGGIGLMLTDGSLDPHDIDWWLTISRPGLQPAKSLASLLATLLLFRQGLPRLGIPPLATGQNSDSAVAVIPPVFNHWANLVAVFVADTEIANNFEASHSFAIDSVPLQIDWLDCAARLFDEATTAGDTVPDSTQQ